MGNSTEQGSGATIEDLPVAKLHLDRHNPRLPEHLIGKPERTILKYLFDTANLTELAQSIVDNGYFDHEPLLVQRRRDHDYDVLEGNRRLATLIILLKLPIGQDLDLDVDVPRVRSRALTAVPCREVRDRDDVSSFVGFRHIGGLKKWPAESKARYVFAQIEGLAKAGDKDPFKTLGRRVGSNARAMRASYAAIALLRHARDEASFEYRTLIDERRFGVWLRAYDSPKIRTYIRFGDPTTYAEVKMAVIKTKTARLVEVLSDFISDGDRPPIMDDSRDMTLYASILNDHEARSVLRRTKDLQTASLLVVDESLAMRCDRLSNQIDALQDAMLRTRIDATLRDPAENLFKRARALRDVVNGALTGDDND